MQFKSALAVSTAVFVAVMGAYGCSSSPAKSDAGDSGSSDAKPKPDGNVVPDAGCPSGLACELCDVSGYSTTAQSAPTKMLNACTANEISAFVAACFGTSATQQTCNAWQTSEVDAGNCLDCVFTLQSAAAWGFLVCSSTSCSLNTPGCVDLVLNQVSQEKQAGGAGSCGDLISDSYGCQDYACNTCDTSGAPNSDFDTCVQSAVGTECKSFADKVSASGPCDVLNGDAAPAAALNCFPQAQTDVPNMVNIFCGTGQ
jgi:hypothetical protein